MTDVRSFLVDPLCAFDSDIEAAEGSGDRATVETMLREAGRLARERLIHVDLDDADAPVHTPPRLDCVFSKLALKPTQGKCHVDCCETITASGICDTCAAMQVSAATLATIRERLHREIPERFRWARWDGLRAVFPTTLHDWTTKAAHARERLTGNRGVIIGPAGSGKTSLACAWLRGRIEAGEERARFVAAHNLMAPSYIEGVSVLELALSASSLVLDDLGEELAGAQAATGMAAQRIEAVVRLVRIRHDRDMGILVTTGRKPEVIASVYGDGIARRIFENAPMVRL